MKKYRRKAIKQEKRDNFNRRNLKKWFRFVDSWPVERHEMTELHFRNYLNELTYMYICEIRNGCNHGEIRKKITIITFHYTGWVTNLFQLKSTYCLYYIHLSTVITKNQNSKSLPSLSKQACHRFMKAGKIFLNISNRIFSISIGCLLTHLLLKQEFTIIQITRNTV